MGRREQGIIDDIVDIASESPSIGAAIGLAFCAGAIYTQWINPQGLHGLNRVLAMICWTIAAFALVISSLSYVRQKLGQRKRFQRLDSQRSIEDLRRLSFRVEENGGHAHRLHGEKGSDVSRFRFSASPHLFV